MEPKNQNPAIDNDGLDIVIPEALLGEFMLDHKEKELLRGLNAMFTSYFKQNRYFEDDNNTEAVTECYHFCSHFLSHKELFNPQIA